MGPVAAGSPVLPRTSAGGGAGCRTPGPRCSSTGCCCGSGSGTSRAARRAVVEGHPERTREELAAVREATARADRGPDRAFPALALRWSERQHLAELELGEALLQDLAGLTGVARQADGDAPTPG